MPRTAGREANLLASAALRGAFRIGCGVHLRELIETRRIASIGRILERATHFRAISGDPCGCVAAKENCAWKVL
ncbi:hypothetical protein EQ718_03315 [Paracoccus versutus]|uniref:hypothetical protein n=1 Tax=Paracoccus versutus TaxID=34007 RepID=UPI0011C07227|nr:hypothetical protein [Paracoccus versutus]WEJ77968.1 hypothetical protein EQ718_03315 [Paracoccus versutus]